MRDNKKPGDAGGRTPGSTNHFHRNHTNTSSGAQRARMLKELRNRALTTLQAGSELDVLHPAARVMELRRTGVSIERIWTYDETSEGYRHRVARYRLTAEGMEYELPLRLVAGA